MRWKRVKPDNTATDLVRRDFARPGPNQLWVTDITGVLARHRVLRLTDVVGLLAAPERVRRRENLGRIPGHGSSGVRISYLWMLAGDDVHIKPDRMVLG